MNKKLACAITAILGGSSPGTFAAAAAAGGIDTGGGTLEEIIVTAQHRNEGMQDVPIAMQAFTETALSQLNITNFDDYVKYLPNVSSASNGPGQSEIYMRGLSAANTSLFTNADQYIVAQTPMHPRVVGVKFGYSF